MTSCLADLQAVFQTKEAGLLIVGQALDGDLGPGTDDGTHIIHPHSRNCRVALSGRAHLHTDRCEKLCRPDFCKWIHAVLRPMLKQLYAQGCAVAGKGVQPGRCSEVE